MCGQGKNASIANQQQGRPCKPKCYECQKFRHKAAKFPNQQQERDSGNQSSNGQNRVAEAASIVPRSAPLG